MIRAISYARVSSRGQEDNSSLESQIEANREYAEDNGIEIVREYKEVFSGAYLFDRPLLNECRDLIRQGKANALLVYHIDRLSRSISHTAILLDECERYNAKLIFVTGDFENTLEGKLMLSVRSYGAELERLRIAERTTRGRRERAKKGELSFKRKLFGYYLDNEGKRQVFEPEAEIVRQIFQLYLSGKSLRDIADYLNTSGISTPKGKSWYARSVQVTLLNPAYSGHTYAFREKQVAKYVEGKRRVQRIYTEEGRIELEDITPKLVSEEEFEQVQKTLQENRKQKRGKAQTQYLLRGFIRCKTCGRLYSPHRSKGSFRYVCTSVQSKLTHCYTGSLSAKATDEQVWIKIEKILKSKRELNKYIAQRSKIKEPKVKDNSELIKKLENEIERLVSRMAVVDDKIWNVVQKEIEKKQSEINKLKIQQPEKVGRFDEEMFRKTLSEINLSKIDFEAKREILKLFQFSATFDGDNLEINLGV